MISTCEAVQKTSVGLMYDSFMHMHDSITEQFEQKSGYFSSSQTGGFTNA
eukprot:CAMPEP_0194296208 /NCGR_PEP_ID=MMETSP0169-20130528/55477_1 /TAXON_ID=218684 /ORGANISM="Corethron pennatum, Strain L29A3" /LENGTH=49 /DNA_ID=CAMNT_0039045607 /DNA_START=91 /DNA_END=240 /DNA_ORIENTATION=-